MGAMPMRTECKHYESRTYDNGEVVRKCRIDLAPEAPWRCPESCVGYERRMIDAGWQVGSLEKGYDRPEAEPEGEDVAALLDAAEDIVNAAAPTSSTSSRRSRAASASARSGSSRARFRPALSGRLSQAMVRPPLTEIVWPVT